MGKSLEGRVAIVTGSGQGIGRGIAIYLAREGAKVITNNRKPGGVSYANVRREELDDEAWAKLQEQRGDAESTAAFIKAEGNEASPFYGDVSDFDTARRMVEFAVETYGRIDIVVNNAAGLGHGSVVGTSEQDWDYMTIAKMKGAFNLMHFAVPHMLQQRFGRILNCASDAWVGLPNNIAYSAANSGVVGLTKAAAKELFAHNITVNAYCPQGASPGHTYAYTVMMRNLQQAMGDKFKVDKELLAKVEADHGPSVNLGPIIAYLCTDEAAYISGTVFSMTAAGRISYYSEPEIVAEIKKDGEPWTVDELRTAVRGTLLVDYTSPARIDPFQAAKSK